MTDNEAPNDGIDPVRWQRRPGIDVVWREWGGDCVAYEARSGNTCQLPPLSAAVMSLFDDTSASLQELASVIALDLETSPDASLREAVMSSVQQLLDLSWIETVYPS